MGNVGNKEAIKEKKVVAAVEIEKLQNVPAFLHMIHPKKDFVSLY